MTYSNDHAERHAHDDTELAQDCLTAVAMIGDTAELPAWLSECTEP